MRRIGWQHSGARPEPDRSTVVAELRQVQVDWSGDASGTHNYTSSVTTSFTGSSGEGDPGHRISIPVHRTYFRMFTARATTNIATSREMLSSSIIMSLAQGLTADTSVGLKAVAVVKDKCR